MGKVKIVKIMVICKNRCHPVYVKWQVLQIDFIHMIRSLGETCCQACLCCSSTTTTRPPPIHINFKFSGKAGGPSPQHTAAAAAATQPRPSQQFSRLKYSPEPPCTTVAFVQLSAKHLPLCKCANGGQAVILIKIRIYWDYETRIIKVGG